MQKAKAKGQSVLRTEWKRKVKCLSSVLKAYKPGQDMRNQMSRIHYKNIRIRIQTYTNEFR